MSERLIRLGVDVGDARVGVARSDADGVLATPVDTFARESAAAALQAVLVDTGAERVYVGLPKSMNGSEGPAAAKARAFVEELVSLPEAPGEPLYDVFFVDERFTTVSAHKALSASGRKTATHRSVVDQVAAVFILQTALDHERTRGGAVGEPWNPQS